MDLTFRCCLRALGRTLLTHLSTRYLPGTSSSMVLWSCASRTSVLVDMVTLSLLLLGLMRRLRRRRSLLQVARMLLALTLAFALGVLSPLPSLWSTQVGL